MPGKWDKPIRGEPFVPSASQQGALIDAALSHHQHRERSGRQGGDLNTESGLVDCKNETTEDLPRFSVLGIENIMFGPDENEPEFFNRFAIRGVTPSSTAFLVPSAWPSADATANHNGSFAILQEPIGSYKIGKALVSGVTPVQIDIRHEHDHYADIEDGITTHLVSGHQGAARILWPHYRQRQSLGVQWALVDIGHALPAPSMELRVGGLVTDSSLALPTNKFQSGSYAALNLTELYGIGDADQAGVELLTPSANTGSPCLRLRRGSWSISAKIEVTALEPISPAVYASTELISLEMWVRKPATSTWTAFRRWKAKILPFQLFSNTEPNHNHGAAVAADGTHSHDIQMQTVFGAIYTQPTELPLSVDEYDIGIWLLATSNICTLDVLHSHIYLKRCSSFPWSYTIQW